MAGVLIWTEAGRFAADWPKRMVMLWEFERVACAGPTRTGVVPSRSCSTEPSRLLPSLVAVAHTR